MKRNNKLKRGFTLVELVVVIAVVAILAAVSVGVYFGITGSANNSKLETEAKATLNTLRVAAIENKTGNYYLDKDGLTYERSDVIQDDLTKYTGHDYLVLNTEPDKIAAKTVYLYNFDETSSLYETWNFANHFNYYTNEVAGKGAQVNILTGKITVFDCNIPVIKDTTSEEPDPLPEVYYLNVNVNEVKLVLNSDKSTFQVSPTVSENLINPSFSYESKDTSIVTVSSTGSLTALSVGETEVVVKETTKDLTKTIKVTVTDETILLNVAQESVTLILNNPTYNTFNINATVSLPEGSNLVANPSLVYESLNDNVATVSNGIITAKEIGNTNIIVKLVEMPSIFKVINVNVEKEIETLTIDDGDIELSTGVKHILSYSFSPSDATYNQLVWTSSDDSVVSVNNGVLYTHKGGTATISLSNTYNSVSTSINIEVIAPSQSIRFTEEEVDLLPGDTYKLNLITENINENDVQLTTSSDYVEILENNIVEAKTIGTAVIYAKINSLTASITINVIEVTKATEHKPVQSIDEFVDGAKIVLVEKEHSKIATYTSSDDDESSFFHGENVELTTDLNKSGIASAPSYYSEFRLVKNGDHFNLVDQFYRTLSANKEMTLGTDGNNDLWDIVYDLTYKTYVIENVNPEIGRIYFCINVENGNRFNTYKEYYYKGVMSLPSILIKAPVSNDEIEWKLVDANNPLQIGSEVIIGSNGSVVINTEKGYVTKEGYLFSSASSIYDSTQKGFKSFDYSSVNPAIFKVGGTTSEFYLNEIHSMFKIPKFKSSYYASYFKFNSSYKILTRSADEKSFDYYCVISNSRLIAYVYALVSSATNTSVSLYQYTGTSSNRTYFERPSA